MDILVKWVFKNLTFLPWACNTSILMPALGLLTDLLNILREAIYLQAYLCKLRVLSPLRSIHSMEHSIHLYGTKGT